MQEKMVSGELVKILRAESRDGSVLVMVDTCRVATRCKHRCLVNDSGSGNAVEPKNIAPSMSKNRG